jgi:hypothetical protein
MTLPRETKLLICGQDEGDDVTDKMLLEDWRTCSVFEKNMYYDMYSDEYYNLDNLEFYS